MKRSKKCEFCECNFYPRQDKYDSAKTCSLSCRNKLRSSGFSDATKEKDAMVKAFFKHVDKTDTCWVWRNANKGSGKLPYGSLSFRGKRYLAHRLSWTLHNGEIPNGMCVLHKCDNASCVNPDHLFVGTHLDNQRDKVKKGRGTCERLSDKLVLEIKGKLVIGVPSIVLARDYGVSMTTIHSIKSGKTWKDVGKELKISMDRSLSRDDVVEIKKKLAMKISCSRISRDYGVSPTLIHYIKNGDVWRDD